MTNRWWSEPKCIGCGVCVIGCPTDAIELEPVSAEEWFYTPIQHGGMGRDAPAEYGGGEVTL